ncbi:MAG: glycosyltransferase [Clostridia bacterium]
MIDLISIIIPVYKVEKYLDRCVQSVVDQTYTNLEIILVDDGSPDNCPQMCDEWARKDSRIKVIHKENGGVSSARNMGLYVATGEFIGFVDSDDYIESCMYEILINNMNDKEIDLISCGYRHFNDAMNIDVLNDNEEKVYFFEKKNAIRQMILYGELNGYLWCKLFKKILIGNTIFDESITLGEDLLFCLEYLIKTQKVGKINRKLYVYLYNQNENSLTNKIRKTNISLVEALVRILNLELDLDSEANNHIKAKIVLWSSSYIIKSYYENFQNNEDNISYARNVVKKYYPEIRNDKYLTFKKKIMIYFSLHGTVLYALVKRLFEH